MADHNSQPNDSTTGPITRQKLSDQVYERLWSMIVSGELSPGDPFPSERFLMNKFEVGRPAVREAMQTLSNKGVITISQGERSRVNELEATIATQEQAVVQAENTLRLAKINLAQLLLITDYENFDISFEELAIPFSQVMGESPKKIYEKALTIRDDIKLAVTNVEIAETNVALAKGTLQPSLSAF